MDETNDPGLRSFIEVDETSHFPIQNLPFCVFRPRGGEPARVGARIGDEIVDLGALEDRGLFGRVPGLPAGVFASDSLNPFLALGRPVWAEARRALSRLLRAGEPALRDDGALRARAFHPVGAVSLEMPVRMGDYTDFYSSKEHATNVGALFRGKENALMPNWVHLPVAYHGRASSVVLSGAPVRRPRGQAMPEGAPGPVFAPSRLLDFELEIGFFVGPGSALGAPIPIERARDHIFGLVLVNDWSARDIQAWEYQPLGPFTSKNFQTSISPWVVMLEALEPFRGPGPRQEPEPLPYLRVAGDWALDIELEARLLGSRMEEPQIICRGNARHLYWSMPQQLAHHTVTGCNVRPGDLMASGTISSPREDGYGSLLELTRRGAKPLAFPNGETRAFLEDGDTVTLTGWCRGNGYRVGFGEVSGTIVPALEDDHA